MGLDRPRLSDAGIFLNDEVPDQHVGRPTLEREHGHRGFDLATGRVIGEIDPFACVIKVEPARLDAVLGRHLVERFVVEEQALGQVTCRSLFGAPTVPSAPLLLPSCHPVAPLAAEGGEQAAAAQDRLALSVEALPRLGPDDLDPVHTVFQAECCAFSGAVHGGLD